MQNVRDNKFSALLAQEATLAPEAKRLFHEAILWGRLEMCQWLHATFGLTSADVRAQDNWALRSAAQYGYLGVCSWLHATFALTPADARAWDNWALRGAAENGHLAVCRWLHATYSLTPADARAV